MIDNNNRQNKRMNESGCCAHNTLDISMRERHDCKLHNTHNINIYVGCN